MTERPDHPRDALQALLDGRLDAGSLPGVEAHVRSCASCRREVDLLKTTKERTASAFASAGAPQSLEALRQRVMAGLDEEDRARAQERGVAPHRTARYRGDAVRPGVLAWFLGRPFRSVAAVGALALVMTVAVLMLSYRDDLPASVSRGYDEAKGGRIVLDRKTADPRELAAYFAEHLAFKPGVFDLGAMKYRLVGGTVHRVEGRASSLAVYEGPDGRIVTCDMYEGLLAELPKPTLVVENKGVVFHIYERRGRTLVFWADGRVVCVLASDLPSQEIIPLAFAEASKA